MPDFPTLSCQRKAVKSYLLKLSGREEGPYSETQIAQMFSDQRVNRSTPCKPEVGGDWRMVDDYLPTLKYGTQLPAPTQRARIGSGSGASVDRRISLVDIDIPFLSILKFLFKWVAAGIVVSLCLIPLVMLFWLLVAAGIFSFFGHSLPTTPP